MSRSHRAIAAQAAPPAVRRPRSGRSAAFDREHSRGRLCHVHSPGRLCHIHGRGRKSRAGGFTLLEVLLAISIILLLFGGMFVFYEFALDSRERTQAAAGEAQLARAILSQVAADMESMSALNAALRAGRVRRSVTVVGMGGSPPPDSGLVGSADSLSLQSARYVPLTRFAEVKLWDQGGLGGGGTAMSGTTDQTGGEAEQAVRPPMYDVQEVRWFWNYDSQTGAGSGLYRTVRPAVLAPLINTENADSFGPGGTGTGLAGAAGGRGAGQGTAPPPEAEPPPDQAEDADADTIVNPVPGEDEDGDGEEEVIDPLLAVERVSPEVRWIHVRYYDGSTWSDTFQGGATGPAPQAVEIVISFTPLLTAEQIEAGETVTSRFEQMFAEDATEPLPPRTYRRVVYLPTATLSAGSTVQMQRR